MLGRAKENTETFRTSIPDTKRTNNSAERENIGFEHSKGPKNVYKDFIDNSKNMFSRKKLSEAALFIEDEGENEELKIDGRASSLDCYSDPEELP